MLIIFTEVSATNTQFSVAMHVMTALGYYAGQKVVSADLTESVNADASFVRRILAKLSKASLVTTSVGKNGHCALAKPAKEISLLEIYRAMGPPDVFAIHAYPPEKTCVISRNVKGCMEEVLDDVQASFERSLAEKHLSDLVDRIRKL